MTPDLADTLAAYRHGLEAQIHLLETLADIAARQRDACLRVDAAALADACIERDRVMEMLFGLEAVQRPQRDRIVEALPAARRLDLFETVSRLHRRAEACLAELDRRDAATRAQIEQSDMARRASATALETGETTLAAYRKILSVESRSSILNSRG